MDEYAQFAKFLSNIDGSPKLPRDEGIISPQPRYLTVTSLLDYEALSDESLDEYVPFYAVYSPIKTIVECETHVQSQVQIVLSPTNDSLGRRRHSDSVSPENDILGQPPCKRHAGSHHFTSSDSNEHTIEITPDFFILTGENRAGKVTSMGYFFGVDPFIPEDLTSRTRYLQRKMRSQLEIEERKDDIRQLKEFGGACLWCYRSKKRCGAAYPCPSCVKTNRSCIRNSCELSLASLLVAPTKTSSWAAFGLPLQAALDRFQVMGDRAFHKRKRFNAVIHFGQQGDPLLDKWNIRLSQDDLDLSQLSRFQISSALHRLINNANPHFNCPGLAQLENEYAHHSLVISALQMARLVMTIGSLANCRVHARVSDLDQGQVAMFLIFHVCFLDLTFMSNQFANDICFELRTNRSSNSTSLKQLQMINDKRLNSVWVAIAIYLRVIGGCLKLQKYEVIESLFGQLEKPLLNLHSTVLQTVKVVNIFQKASLKAKARQILKTQIPELPTDHHIFDLAFSLESTKSEDTSTVQDPFSEDQYDLSTCLHECTGLHLRPETAQPIHPHVHNTPPEFPTVPFLASKLPATPILRPTENMICVGDTFSI